MSHIIRQLLAVDGLTVASTMNMKQFGVPILKISTKPDMFRYIEYNVKLYDN